MADFLIQRGSSTIANGATTATATAGTDYTAPASNTSAFIRIVASRAIGCEGTASTEDPNAVAARVSNPANIVTSITFTRATADTTTLVIDWEIVEYTGPGGGDNEFIVRLAEAVTYSAAVGTASGTAVTGVVDDDDVALILTGQSTPGTAYANLMSTLAWNAGTQKCDATRHPNNEATIFSYAAVEFTGSNWTVQRVQHTFATAGATETETISSVGSLTRAFTHNQFRVTGEDVNYGMSAEMWLTDVDEASFKIDSQASIAGTTPIGVVWVISNSQTGTGESVAARYTGTFNSSGTTNVTVTAVAAINNASVWGESQTNTQDTSSPGRDQMRLAFTTTTNVAVVHVGTLGTTTYRFETFEWPTAASVGTAVVTGTAEPTATEAEIVAGGQTVIITLTGDTWVVAAGGLFDAQRQNIIDGLDSAQSEATGWNNEVRDNLAVTDVVRTSDTVVTVTLSAQAAYQITANETITVTVPSTATLLNAGAITASPTFVVTATASLTLTPALQSIQGSFGNLSIHPHIR